MIPAMIVMGPGGGISFETARTFIIANWDKFPDLLESYGVSMTSMFEGVRDFESTSKWFAFRCPAGCNRVLPLDCADLDHATARVKINTVYHAGSGGLGRVNANSPWDVYDQGAFFVISYTSGEVVMTDYTYNTGNGQITFKKPGFGTNAIVSLKELLECDATNLQPLCPRCNRSKGGK